jgi:hypothetical protein
MERSAEIGGVSKGDASWGERLQEVAFVILGLLPLGMVFGSRSAPAFLACAALASLGGRLVAGEGAAAVTRLRGLLRSPLAVVSLAFLGLAAASLGWGYHPRLAVFVLGETLLSAGAALVLAATLPKQIPPRILLLAAAAFALACILIITELVLGLPLRRALGLRAVSYIFNRPAITLLLVFWPLARLLWIGGQRFLVGLLGLLAAAAVLYCDSGAAVLGMAGAALAFALAQLSPRLGAGLVGLGMLASLGVAPVLGEIVDRLMPPTVVEGLQNAHARDRIEIWQSFGAVVKERFLLGTGFGTSAALASDPVVQEVPQKARVLLGVWHAHNGYLQIWIELGVIGAALAAAAVVLLLRGLSRQPRDEAAANLATVGAAAAIMLVGHGAWQGWWIATLGLSALWIARAPDRSDSKFR